MDPDHIDITCFRSNALDVQSPSEILEDLEEPHLKISEQPDRRTEIIGQAMSYIYGLGLHPLTVIERTYQFLASLESRSIAYQILNSDAPQILSTTPSDICNAIRLKDKAIPNADQKATEILQTAIDRNRIKIPAIEDIEIPQFSEAEFSEAEQIGEFLIGDGPSIRPVFRRISCAAKSWYPHHLGNAAFQVLADLTGESRQAWKTRTAQLHQSIITATGSMSHGAGFTATDSHRAACSEAGKKSWKERKTNQPPGPEIG